MSDSGFPGASGSCLPSLQQDVFLLWTVVSEGDYEFSICNSSNQVDWGLNIHLGGGCSGTCIAFNDDFCGTASGVIVPGLIPGDTLVIQIGSLAGGGGLGDLLIQEASEGEVLIEISCLPTPPHSGGGTADLSTSSFGSGVGSGLHLECLNGPPSEFGFVLVSDAFQNPAPLFQGQLCLDGNGALGLGRYNSNVATNLGLPELNSVGQFDALGVLQSLTGNAASSGGSGFDVPLTLPLVGGPQIQPGDTLWFQVWFRDSDGSPGPPTSANLSNMIEATFL